MTRTLQIEAEIPDSREIVIHLPEDIPPGAATIVLAVMSGASLEARKPVCSTLGDLLHSEFFGMWEGRDDIIDSAVFARDLRAGSWHRA